MLLDFLDEHQRIVKNAFGIVAQAYIEQFLEKCPIHEEINLSGPTGKWHVWRERLTPWERARTVLFGSSWWATINELQVNTVSSSATNSNDERPKPTCHQWKNPGHYKNQNSQLKREKQQTEGDITKTTSICRLPLACFAPSHFVKVAF